MFVFFSLKDRKNVEWLKFNEVEIFCHKNNKLSDGKQKYIKQKDLIEKLNCENQSEQLVKICENRSRILIYEQKKEIFIVWILRA